MIEWWAFGLTLIAVVLTAFSITPWNLILGAISCIAWCIYAYDKELIAVFWLNAILGAIYSCGFIGHLLL
jgi:4-hydroxybenzoate polyprenyltransferase